MEKRRADRWSLVCEGVRAGVSPLVPGSIFF